jgi:hypothetical protein|tara:strand:+ start:32599 stop:32781 length:183 start_codon:yes stop_codon:yes gene_type:complete
MPTYEYRWDSFDFCSDVDLDPYFGISYYGPPLGDLDDSVIIEEAPPRERREIRFVPRDED